MCTGGLQNNVWHIGLSKPVIIVKRLVVAPLNVLIYQKNVFREHLQLSDRTSRSHRLSGRDFQTIKLTTEKSGGMVKVKVKVWALVIAPLTRVRLVTSSALQSRKWQLTGMRQWCRSALFGHPLPALADNCTHGAASSHTIAPISHTRPSPRSGSYYSFPVPMRVGG